MYDATLAETVTIRGDGGDEIEAYLARPMSQGPLGGAVVTGAPPEGMPLKVGPIKHLTKDLSCPLLGLFGADDQYPSPDQVNELEDELRAQGKTYEFHIYDGVGHGFFSVNRPAYRPEAAVDGWQKTLTWFGRYLASSPAR